MKKRFSGVSLVPAQFNTHTHTQKRNCEKRGKNHSFSWLNKKVEGKVERPTFYTFRVRST